MSTFEGERPLSDESQAILAEFRTALDQEAFTVDGLHAEEQEIYTDAFERVRAQLTFFKRECGTPTGDDWHSVHDLTDVYGKVVWIYGKPERTYVAICEVDDNSAIGRTCLRFTEHAISNEDPHYLKQCAEAYKDLYDDWNPTREKLGGAALIQVQNGQPKLFRGEHNFNTGQLWPVDPLAAEREDEQLSDSQLMDKRSETIGSLARLSNELGFLSTKLHHVEGASGNYY